MSRVGKEPISIPSGVEVSLKDSICTVKGPKGELQEAIDNRVDVAISDNEVVLTIKSQDDKTQRSLWGLSRQLISNMVEGVTKGFEKKLEVNGVGYKADMKGSVLVLSLGYSHPIEFKAPDGIEISSEKNVITITGISKQQVGQVAAEIRGFRKPEPYKGKGIKYVDEVIRRKAGKAAAKAG